MKGIFGALKVVFAIACAIVIAGVVWGVLGKLGNSPLKTLGQPPAQQPNK